MRPPTPLRWTVAMGRCIHHRSFTGPDELINPFFLHWSYPVLARTGGYEWDHLDDRCNNVHLLSFLSRKQCGTTLESSVPIQDITIPDCAYHSEIFPVDDHDSTPKSAKAFGETFLSATEVSLFYKESGS